MSEYAILVPIPSLERIKESCGSWESSARELYKIIKALKGNHDVLSRCNALIKPSKRLSNVRAPKNTILSMKHDLAKAGLIVKKNRGYKSNKEAAAAVLDFVSKHDVYHDNPEDRSAGISNLSKRISELESKIKSGLTKK